MKPIKDKYGYREYGNSEDFEFSELKGKTLTACGREGEDLIFVDNESNTYAMTYFRDCCASVNIEDIYGELTDLVGSPILVAEESTGHDDPKISKRYGVDSHTWTFYKLSTIKGSVTIRWYGESNGYYSEEASFVKVLP